MTWSIEFIPILPPAVMAAATIAVLIVAALLLWRNQRGAMLRVLALGFILLALANPNLLRQDRQKLSNIVAVVADVSTSQTLGNRKQRLEHLRRELGERLAALPDVEVRLLETRKAEAANREETAVFGALAAGLSDIPPDRLAGVILLTDGQIHDAPDKPESLGIDAPVHTLITGSPGERDNRVEVVSAPRFGLVNTDQFAEVRVERHGTPADPNAPARLRIHRQNEPVEEITATFGETVRIRFPFRHAGQTIMEVELEPEPGELTLVNNRAVIQAEGVRENLRVLLVSGEPHAGERTWRNLLRSDASVDLVHFTILRPPEKQDGTPINQLSLIAFPTRELFSEKLHEFDLIIFDRYQRRGVLPLIYLDNVARFVEAGGAVLVAAGADYASPYSLSRTPLADVLPARPTGQVIEKPFRPRLTEAGLKHPVTSGLPGAGGPGKPPSWGRWFRNIEATAINGDVVMTGADGAPLLVLSRQGEGRVAVLLSDHAWLWARGYDGGGPHVDLLRRLSHWLMKEPDLEEEWLRASSNGNQLIIERRSMQDAVGDAEITMPSGEKRTIALQKAEGGLWRAVVDTQESGVHRVAMEGLSAIALVGQINSKEFAQVVATDEHVKGVASATRGGIFWMGAGANERDLPRVVMTQGSSRFHGETWMGLRDRDPHLVLGVEYQPLYAGFAALALLLGMMALTWYREGR